ncbi:hypothetical protein FSARC_14041 [Fusarium sarcochroum]|uniref:Uncharacterized protein n=1 Tax=Fusarium sarcochroum TaxID=1208366 RepID=A0A8H4SWK7_9HYPO|nr:hypothetical protein FSARC_14041 [Fusarium sarcochroum]
MSVPFIITSRGVAPDNPQHTATYLFLLSSHQNIHLNPFPQPTKSRPRPPLIARQMMTGTPEVETPRRDGPSPAKRRAPRILDSIDVAVPDDSMEIQGSQHDNDSGDKSKTPAKQQQRG